jgi:hypothetical protein
MPVPIMQDAPPGWDPVGRFLFPQDRLTFYYSRAGDPILMPPQVPIVIYSDQAATTLAPDLHLADGTILVDSTVLVGTDGLIPEFYGAVGIKRLYGKPFGATVTYPLEAEFGPILQALYDSGYSTDVIHMPNAPRNDGTVMVWDATAGKPRLVATLQASNIPSLSSLYDAVGAAVTAANAAQAAAIAASATDATNKANAAKAASIPVTQKGAPSGVATLDSNGLIPNSQLPPLAIKDTFVVSSQAAMLALTAQRGDIAIRTDQSKSYILQSDPASTLGNWLEIAGSGSGSVLSVDGQTGVVVLSGVYAAKTHAAQHASAGADPVSPASIGAETPTGAQTKATTAQAAAIADAATKYIPTTQKGAASGIASLDGSTKVPTAQIPSLPYDGTGSAAAAQAAAIADAATKYLPLTQKGAASGLATLDSGSKVPTVQIPTLPYDASGAATAAQAAAIAAAATDATTKANTAQSNATTAAASDAATKYVPKTLTTTKGDLIGASGTSTPARVPVGTDGQFLIADSAQGTGLRWASIASEPVIYYDTGSSSYPARPVLATPVMWVGPVAPLIGGIGATDGLDFWRKTP